MIRLNKTHPSTFVQIVLAVLTEHLRRVVSRIYQQAVLQIAMHHSPVCLCIPNVDFRPLFVKKPTKSKICLHGCTAGRTYPSPGDSRVPSDGTRYEPGGVYFGKSNNFVCLEYRQNRTKHQMVRDFTVIECRLLRYY